MILDDKLFEKFGVEYGTNEIIFCEYEPGNEFYFIHSGKVKVVKIINNTEKTIDILDAGEFFGEMAILEDTTRSASLIAVGHVKLFKFHKDNFETILKMYPQLAYKLLMVFAGRINDQKRQLKILLLEEPNLKVMDVFNMFVEKDPNAEFQDEIPLKITAQDVSSWAGMQVSEVQKILNHMNHTGKIELFNDKIIVKYIREFKRQVESKRNKMYS
jgi:CRP/FNR family transcriptional regulator, cyclic AMP receptor protein